MGFRTNKPVALCALLIAACSSSTGANTVEGIRAACNAGASHVEAHLSGDVARVLGVREGPSGAHEGFVFVTGTSALRVEDNVDITGIIPLRRGERVELLGQYECDDAVIHWTHRDPRGRHISGFIKVNGHTYN